MIKALHGTCAGSGSNLVTSPDAEVAAAATMTNHYAPTGNPTATQERFNVILSSRQKGVRPTGKRR